MYDMRVKHDYRNISGLNWEHLQNPGCQFFVQILVAVSDSKQWTICVSNKRVSGFLFLHFIFPIWDT